MSTWVVDCIKVIFVVVKTELIDILIFLKSGMYDIHQGDVFYRVRLMST